MMKPDPKTPMAVLVVEDFPEEAQLVREILTREPHYSFHVHLAETLKQALDVLESEHVDAVLLDLNLPDSEGLETFKAMQARFSDVPVVILTGLEDEATGLEAVRLGAQEYLVKSEVGVKILPRLVRYAIERNRTADQLRRSEERFEIVAKATNDVIWDWDLDANRVWWSDNIRTLFRYKPEDVGHTLEWWTERVHPDDRERFRSGVDAVIHSGWQFWSGEYRFLRGDGTYVAVLDRGYVVQDAEGTPVRMIGAMIDITDRKRAERAMMQAQKMEAVAQLAGGIAHDFNNVLATLLGYTRLAIDGVAKESEQREFLEQVLKAGARATELVGQIATFSRRSVAEAKKSLRQMEVTVKEIVKFLRPTLPSNIFIHAKIAEKLPAVLVDASQLQQVLVNLCANSCQAMPHGGTLTVGMQTVTLDRKGCDQFAGIVGEGALEPGVHVVLSVEDTGAGIHPDVLPRIFEPSFTTRPPAAGMGLATVLNFVRGHEGNVRVQSLSGKGTTVEIFLPAAKEAGTKEEAPKTDGAVKGGKESILVVDDEEALAEMLGETLEMMGYRVTVQTSSTQALSVFRDRPRDFDLVVLDQIMPALTGDKLAEEITGLRPGIPIILCSGYAHILSQERMKEVGIRRFLNKPMARRELEKEIRVLLDEAKTPSLS